MTEKKALKLMRKVEPDIKWEVAASAPLNSIFVLGVGDTCDGTNCWVACVNDKQYQLLASVKCVKDISIFLDW